MTLVHREEIVRCRYLGTHPRPGILRIQLRIAWTALLPAKPYVASGGCITIGRSFEGTPPIQP